MKFILLNQHTPIFAMLFFAALCVEVFYLNVMVVLVSVALLAIIVYYCYSLKRLDILLYPIILGIFLESILTVIGSENIPISLFQILFVLGFTIYVLLKFVHNDFQIKTNNYWLPLLLFLALISLSLIYSDGRVGGVLNLIRLMVLLIFVWFMTNIVVETKTIINSLLIATLICLVLSTYSLTENIFNTEAAIQNFLGGGFKVNRSSAGGIYTDPNRFAASLFMPIAFVFSYLNSNEKLKYRMLGGVAFFLLLGGIFSTYSRSGFISVVLICTVIIIYFNRFKPFLLLLLFFVGIAFIVPSLRLSLFSYSERILELLSGNIDTSNSIRIMLGTAAIQMFFDTYSFGVGFDAFGEQFTKYYTLQQTIGVHEPHNITYTILAELGITGLFIFSALVFFIIRDAYENVKASKQNMDEILSISLFTSLIAYLVFYQFYGGALFDSALMLNIGLILSHKKILT